MANVWFLSDLHLGHKAICKYRTQFTTQEEHNEYIKEQYHSAVTKRDTVFFLGDVAFTKEALEDVKSWTAEQKILICGNHDLDKLHMSDLVEAFDKVYSLLKYKEFWLSHAPIHPDELRGKNNIHGHVHHKSIDDVRYLNVSMENLQEYKPISLMQVREIFNERNN